MEKKIGAKIKELRKERKDTLKSLAEKIDYDWSNLSKVERGIYSASIDLIKKISEVYNLNVNYFFDGLTDAEGDLLTADNLEPKNLKEKYSFRDVDGKEATDEEIMMAIRLIRQLRQKED